MRDLLIYFLTNKNNNYPCSYLWCRICGIQLANSLKNNKDYKLLFFDDDNKHLWSEINGINILPNNIEKEMKLIKFY